jgi:hypothetical protein
MYSDLIRAPQSILFGFPLIRQVLYLLVTFIYIFTLDFPWLDLEWELFTQTVRVALTHVDQSRLKVSDTYRSSYRNANDFPHIKSWRLFTYTNSTTFCSPFYCIKPSKHLVFLVYPACYRPFLVSCVTFLSLIIFKIIPHPMTLLIAFPLQVIVSYFILHRLLLLLYHFITYLLPMVPFT